LERDAPAWSIRSPKPVVRPGSRASSIPNIGFISHVHDRPL
jgi:hypothetical protein